MLNVIVWWFWIQVIGLAALPLTYHFFRRLPGRGYVFARPLGLLLTSYLLWLGGSLGMLRNSVGGMLFSIVLVAAISVILYRRGRTEGDLGLFAWLRANGRLVLTVEFLFAGALALWALLRAYSPELTTAGGEKFMEIMYLNSIGRSEYFPPHDAWLSGYAISYYYFGYVIVAALTRLTGLPAHLTFNVAVASLFALTCTGAFGIVYDLVKGTLGAREFERPGGAPPRPARPIAWGLLGAVLVAVLGNLQGFLEVLYSARLLPQGFWQWLDIKDINEPFDPNLAPSLVPTRSGWWWWRSSRVIHDLDPLGNSMGIQPIDEFPGFSFLLGDMHPHVLALPFVLLALAIALRTLLVVTDRAEGGEETTRWFEPIRQLPLLVPLCLGALNTHINEASAQIFLRTLKESFRHARKDSDILLTRKDLGAILPVPASDYIEIHNGHVRLGQRVTNLNIVDKYITGISTAEGSIDARYVILATPSHITRNLLEPHSDLHELSTLLQHIEHRPICTVYLQYPERIKLGRWLRGSLNTITQWVFDRRLYGQKGLMAVVISSNGDHMNLDNDALCEKVEKELASLYPHWPKPVSRHVIREKRATFASTVNINQYRPDAHTAVNGLWLAGDYTNVDLPGTLEGAIRSGLKCAQHIINEQLDNT